MVIKKIVKVHIMDQIKRSSLSDKNKFTPAKKKRYITSHKKTSSAKFLSSIAFIALKNVFLRAFSLLFALLFLKEDILKQLYNKKCGCCIIKLSEGRIFKGGSSERCPKHIFWLLTMKNQLLI